MSCLSIFSEFDVFPSYYVNICAYDPIRKSHGAQPVFVFLLARPRLICGYASFAATLAVDDMAQAHAQAHYQATTHLYRTGARDPARVGLRGRRLRAPPNTEQGRRKAC